MSLLTYTGQPFVDIGNAVLTMMCKKEKFNEVAKEDIYEHLDEFLEVIKDHFNDLNATKQELDYSKRGLKQHFTLLYNVNHYLFGINNKVENPLTGKKETVQTGEEFIITFKETVIQILEGKNSLCQDENRISKDNICRFCGKPSDIILSKDIIPLGAGLTQKNLGQVHCCNSCYLPILFLFVPMLNVRGSEASKGVYMFYQFSNERYMVEYARHQYNYLKKEMLASLEMIQGNWYEVLVDDLRKRYPRFKRKIKPLTPHYITAYYFLNDNRGAMLHSIDVPNGMCRFIDYMCAADHKWNAIKRNFSSIESYERFMAGTFYCMHIDGTPKYGFEEVEDVKFYMKEVSIVEQQFIDAAENIAKGLLKYYRSSNQAKWIEEYAKKMNIVKDYAFINNLLDVNEGHFKLNGENIFDLSDVKQVMAEKRGPLAFRLIKYFIYNNMNDEEVEAYIHINRSKKNLDQEGEEVE